jgi:hydrogenase maturation protein HypF
MKRLRIEIAGVVQGVGFRPFVFTLAEHCGVAGYVTNTSRGVVIEAEGDRVDAFCEALHTEAPPLAEILSFTIAELPLRGETGFVIRKSRDEGSFTHISPDVAVCDDCLREMFDPADRRYHYPFINCTNCGPRFTITKCVPYDRPNTTMADFPLCEQCSVEYHDPRDRRFHAQPNACPVCGPRVSFELGDQAFSVSTDDPIAAAREVLLAGGIVAVKGLGGFHLCCDATNALAVEELRLRKRRRNKPFALMSGTLDEIRESCLVSGAEAALLTDRRRPIVLLRKHATCCLPAALAPNNATLGFMLPYTPIHHLLFDIEAGGVAPFRVLVMTSANLSEEPIVIDNHEARERLAGIADAFLLHNRDIFMRLDDSVVRVINGKTRFLRRARGYAPGAIDLGEESPDLLAAGAEVKNTFAITKGRYAIVSQHIGDMENYETLAFFEEALANLRQVYRADPVALAHDLHPGYLASQWALRHCDEHRKICLGVQHHHAHIASVIAEHHSAGPVIGIALDGSGYGHDGTIWGSEFLLCEAQRYERYAHFAYLPLPGGEQAIRECWRISVSLLIEAFGRDACMSIVQELGYIARFGEQAVRQVHQLAELRQFSPLSCGAGRYFDAIAALIGLCGINTYEGEAAITLESILPPDAIYDQTERYTFKLGTSVPVVIDFCPLVREVVRDLRAGVSVSQISHRFHNTMVAVVSELAADMAARYNTRTIGLSGGVFQNAYLLSQIETLLEQEGYLVLVNHQLPANDACMSLGQVWLLAHSLRQSISPDLS